MAEIKLERIASWNLSSMKPDFESSFILSFNWTRNVYEAAAVLKMKISIACAQWSRTFVIRKGECSKRFSLSFCFQAWLFSEYWRCSSSSPLFSFWLFLRLKWRRDSMMDKATAMQFTTHGGRTGHWSGISQVLENLLLLLFEHCFEVVSYLCSERHYDIVHPGIARDFSATSSVVPNLQWIWTSSRWEIATLSWFIAEGRLCIHFEIHRNWRKRR